MNTVSDWLIVGQALVIVGVCVCAARIAKVSVERQELCAQLTNDLKEEQEQRRRLQAEIDSKERSRRATSIVLRREWAGRAREREERGYTKRGFCVVCLSSTGEIYAAVPCGHACMCKECADALRDTTHSCCPFCRQRSSNFIRIFEAKGEEDPAMVAQDEANQQPQRRKERKSLRHRFISMFR